MRVLALETTGELCSIAVCDDRGVIAGRAYRHRMHLLERLTPDIDAVLADAEVKLEELDGIAVGVGPGSFTGIRVGLTTAKMLADTCGLPICGVPTQDALAAEHVRPAGKLVAALIRARPGTVYAALYRWTNLEPVRFADPTLLPISEVAQLLAQHAAGTDCLLCGDALTRYREALSKAITSVPLIWGRSVAPSAGTIAEIGRRRIAASQVDDPVNLLPLYVAPPAVDRRAERFGPSAGSPS